MLARLALQAKDTDQALAELERGLAGSPTDVALLTLKADTMLARGERAKAADVYRKMIGAHPSAVRARVALADLQAGDGALEAGEQTLRDGVAVAPASTSMRLALADFLARNRNVPGAEKALREGIANSANDSVYDIALANLLARDGRPDQAVATLNTTAARLKEGPAWEAAMMTLARVTAAQGDMTGARAPLGAVLKAHPDNDQALLLRAEIETASDPGAAVADLLAVTARQPANPAVFTRLAAAYLRQGKNKEGLAALTRVADLDPKNFDPVARLSDAAMRVGLADQARTAVDAFVQRNPDSAVGRIGAVRFAIASKQWQEAESKLQDLRRLANTDEAADALAGEIKEGEKLPAQAAEIYKPLLRSKSGGRFNPAAARAFIRASFAANQGETAAAALAALAQGASGTEGAAIALEQFIHSDSLLNS